MLEILFKYIDGETSRTFYLESSTNIRGQQPRR